MNSTSLAQQHYVLGLGANLGDNLKGQLEGAIALIAKHPSNMRVVETAPFFQSLAEGIASSDQLQQPPPAFLNTAICVSTTLLPQELMKVLLEIEISMGRIRPNLQQVKDKAQKFSRPIDLDILFWQHHFVYSSTLKIPHPHWYQRSFVVRPLLELKYWREVLGPVFAPFLMKNTNGLTFQNEARALKNS